MTREEKRREASIDYQLSTRPITIGGDTFLTLIKIKIMDWAIIIVVVLVYLIGYSVGYFVGKADGKNKRL